jgi:two-component system sensor histidine kinase TorS
MGGRLWVESEPGHGSTFYLAVTLPVASDPPARLKHTQGGAPETGTLHALVVDDEEYNRIALSGFLEEIGLQVTAAATGEEALAIARHQPLQAVFLDINLPGLSGPDIARALRAMENLAPDLPIIATTAYTTEEKRRLCTAAGMSSFLTKPVSLERIHAALTAATATQRATASFHPPGEEPPADPLDNLRLLAQRKGVSLATESALFLTELASETRLLAEAIKRREPATAGETAHRLVGRLAFVRATLEAQLAGEIEAGSMNELWDQADASASRLAGLLPGLRDRIAAAR